MAKRLNDTPDDELQEDTPSNDERLTDRMAAAITKGISDAAPKKVSFARYDPQSPNQMGTPKRAMPKLSRNCFQNGQMMNAEGMTAEEIGLLNQITKSGRYVDRRVEVLVREEGTEQVVELRYSDTVNASLSMRSKIRVAESDSPLANMLYQILKEQSEATA